MREMSLEAVNPKANISRRNQENRVYTLPVACTSDPFSQPGMGYGHHVHTAGLRMDVAGGAVGLVLPLRDELVLK